MPGNKIRPPSSIPSDRSPENRRGRTELATASDSTSKPFLWSKRTTSDIPGPVSSGGGGSAVDTYVRRARLADKAAVLAIDRGLYQGCDYMAALYTGMFHTPEYHPYVALVNGEVKVFKCFYVLDEGGTVFQFGSRTAEAQQGQGLLQRITTEARPALEARYPLLQRLMWAGLGSQRQDRFKGKYSGLYREHMVGTIFLYRWPVEFLRKICTDLSTRPNDPTSINNLSVSKALGRAVDFQRLFSSQGLPYLCESIFLVHDVTVENIKCLLRTYNVIASFDAKDAIIACSFHNTSHRGEGCELFSAFTFYGDVLTYFASHFCRYVASLERAAIENDVPSIAYVSFARRLSEEEKAAVLAVTGQDVAPNGGRTDISVISIPW